jgi:hypothetical protein
LENRFFEAYTAILTATANKQVLISLHVIRIGVGWVEGNDRAGQTQFGCQDDRYGKADGMNNMGEGFKTLPYSIIINKIGYIFPCFIFRSCNP